MLARLTDQAIAQIVNTNPRWMDEYVVYRELGHHSVFGEESLSDLTELQLKLLSITHTYDVVQSSLNTHDSYEGGTTEIPAKIRPYPTNLLKWYKEWSDKARKKSEEKSKRSSSTKSRPTQTIFQDDESDEEALAAYVAGQTLRNPRNINKAGR